MTTKRKTESDLVTSSELILHAVSARRSNNPARRKAAAAVASMAGAALGSIPKKRHRPWTGWVGDVHLRRGCQVILPSGTVAEVFGVKRGLAAVTWKDPFWIEGVRRDVLPVSQLTLLRNPAAVLLGKLKSGCREAPSEKKIASSRKNGQMPCHPGRHRGRPRKDRTPPTDSYGKPHN